jgi:hypothetical protein
MISNKSSNQEGSRVILEKSPTIIIKFFDYSFFYIWIGLTAKNEIEQLEKQDLLEMNKREISSQSRKKIVAKKIELYVIEQNKLEDERIKQEEANKKYFFLTIFINFNY